MIKVQNIYYMLAYAFGMLNEDGYKNIAIEEFEYTADLLAAILANGMAYQVKRGLGRNYVRQRETLKVPKGKMDITSSVKQQTIRMQQMACEYDEFSEDIYLNQILKSTAMLLIRCDEVKVKRKKELKRVLLYFNQVSTIQLNHISWSSIKYDKHNVSYKPLINICYLVVKGMLYTESNGTMRVQQFIDDQRMSSLYERFVRAYYKKHYPQLHPAASQVSWNLTNEDNTGIELLPVMKTDITLEYKDKVLIIDTKYYGHAMQQNTLYNKQTFHSHNMYQIFTYVKNKDKDHSGKVSGILLYAKTDDEITPDHSYIMDQNKITVTTLDLSGDFQVIRNKLDHLIEEMV